MRDNDGMTANGNGASRFNSYIAVSVAIISTFLGVTKIKDDNVVQAMLMAKSNAVDTWAEYQSKKIKHHLSELGLKQTVALRAVATGKGAAILDEQAKDYRETIARYETEEPELKQKARAYEKEYDALNYRDDQFDLSDAALSVSLAMLALAALTNKRWLLWLAWCSAGLGFVMGIAGLFGIHIHPDWLTSLLS